MTKKKVFFRWHYEGDEVRVAGTFNKWNQISINEPVSLAPGKYEYKFNVDGTWCYDVLSPTCDDNCGGFNNVIWI